MIRKRVAISVIVALLSSLISTSIAHADGTPVGTYVCGEGDFEVAVEFDDFTVPTDSGSDCTGEVIIPDGVTRIGFRAFLAASSVTSVVIPDSVKNIGNQAFKNNTRLTNIVFGSGLIEIGSQAFQNANKLTSLNLPDSLTFIGNDAFRDTVKLTSVTFGNNLNNIGSGAFQRSDLRNVVVPGSIATIGDEAFMNNPNLTTFRFNQPDWSKPFIPELEIGSYVFLAADAEAPTNLTTLWLPSNLSFWGNDVLPANNSESNLKHVYYCGPYESEDSSIGINIFEKDQYNVECPADLVINPSNSFTSGPGDLHTVANSGSAGSTYNATTNLNAISGCDTHKYFELSNPINDDGSLVNPDAIKSLTFSTGVPVTREMTWAMWLNTSDERGDGEGFTSGIPILGADIPGAYNDYQIFMNAGKIFWGLGSETAEQDYGIGAFGIDDAPINDGQWHYIVVTRNFWTANIEIYIDGNLQVSGGTEVDGGYIPNDFKRVHQNASYLLEEGHTDNFRIGQWRSDFGPDVMVFNGKIGAIEAFAQVLNGDQILAKYNTDKSNYVSDYSCAPDSKDDEEAARLAAAAEAARLAAIEAARLAAAKAAEDAARRAREQKELTELLSVIPSIAGLALNLGDLTNSLLLKQKCVKGKKSKFVRYGAKCPKGYIKRK